MKASRRYALATSALLVICMGSALGAQGSSQALRPGQTPGPRFLVPILRSAERTLGLQAGDAIRERMMGDFMASTLVIVPKSDIENNLESSGYSKTEALTANDLKMLAPLLRAEEYLDGTIIRTDAGTLVARLQLNLVRPDGMTQPLPEVTGAKVGDIAKLVSSEVDKARKQIPHNATCMLNARQSKFPEAVAAAQKGTAAYPRAVFVRVCMLEVAIQAKFGPDSIIKFSEEILAIYPENKRALRQVTDAYGQKNMEDKYITSMMNLLKADPTDAALQETVVRVLAEKKKWEMAKSLIDEMVKQSPGDVGLTKLQLAIYREMKDFKGANAIAQELIKTDTAAADTLFFKQMIAGYAADSQPQKAAEVAARAAAKFPRNTFFWLSYGQLSRQTGQLPQALEAFNKALALDPKTPGAHLQRALIFREMNQPDSVIAALRAAVAAGDDKAAAGNLALSAGQPLLNEWSRDSAKTVDRGEYVLGVLIFADSLNSSDASQFLMGAAKLSLGQLILTPAAKDKNFPCETAKKGQVYIQDAGTHIQKGGRAYPQQAGTMMNGQMQLVGYAEQVVKVVCKKH